jgi:hypothetical protein
MIAMTITSLSLSLSLTLFSCALNRFAVSCSGKGDNNDASKGMGDDGMGDDGKGGSGKGDDNKGNVQSQSSMPSGSFTRLSCARLREWANGFHYSLDDNSY